MFSEVSLFSQSRNSRLPIEKFHLANLRGANLLNQKARILTNFHFYSKAEPKKQGQVELVRKAGGEGKGTTPTGHSFCERKHYTNSASNERAARGERGSSISSKHAGREGQKPPPLHLRIPPPSSSVFRRRGLSRPQAPITQPEHSAPPAARNLQGSAPNPTFSTNAPLQLKCGRGGGGRQGAPSELEKNCWCSAGNERPRYRRSLRPWLLLA